MIKGMTTTIDSVTADIGADKFATADDMLTALAGKLMAALNPGGGGGRPKPPGGAGTPKPPPGGG
jgi:hypothetical protein